jgi:hypothetical protein
MNLDEIVKVHEIVPLQEPIPIETPVETPVEQPELVPARRDDNE